VTATLAAQDYAALPPPLSSITDAVGTVEADAAEKFDGNRDKDIAMATNSLSTTAKLNNGIAGILLLVR
jgi:hypothetical protein